MTKKQKSAIHTADSVSVSIRRVECRADSSHSYDIALPGNFNTNTEYPLIITLDPHGDGNLAVRSMTGGGTNSGFIVAGSNVIRNGYENLEYAFNILTNDILNQFPVNKDRIYVAGFSGGGRLAQIYSQINTNVKAVISMGAGYSLDPSRPLPNNIPMLFLVGDEDFNYLEIMNSKEMLTQSDVHYYIIDFHGKHEWPAPEIVNEALMWFEFDDYRRNAIRNNNPVIKDYREKIRENAIAFKANKDIISACKEYEKGIAFLKDLTNTRSFINELNRCKESPEYQSASGKIKNALTLESRLQQGYMSALDRKDTIWWRNEIRRLNQAIAEEEDPFISSAYLRVKGFLSMAAYSLCNRSLNEDDLPGAMRRIDIYQIIDPGNPDVYYFRALYYAKNGQSQKAIQLFRKAVDSGFKDLNKARQELPVEVFNARQLFHSSSLFIPKSITQLKP